jgi:phosphohistidine phosphatase
VDLILWRHAEAHDAQEGQDDLERALTKRGEKQAAKVAQWLDRRLPDGVRVLCSPAVRAVLTAHALDRKQKVCPELAPGCSVAELLTLARWPDGKSTVLVVGHQPVLGQAIAQLLGLSEAECAVKKGALWWLRSRQRVEEGRIATVVVTVQSPEVL